MTVQDLQKAKNIGKICAEKIYKAGIENLDEMKKLGTKEVFFKIFETHGYGLCLCSCFLYVLEGAITDTKWNEIPETKKEEFKAFMKDFRKSL